MKYAIINENNFPVAFYASEVHGENIPAEAIEITDEQWRELVENQGQRKLVDGEVVEYTPPEPPAVIPDRVTARQFKLQLLASGYLDAVEAWIATQPRAVQIAYANSGTFVRDEPMLQAGFNALNFTHEQGDAFFTAAAAL